MSNNHIIELNLKSLFSKERYVIPIYQRNFAWGESEIAQLIQDVSDSLTYDKDKNYYLGTLVVFERNSENQISYETIDGQQRLTALTLIISAIKNTYLSTKEDIEDWFNLNLEFDSRIISTDTLKGIYSNDLMDYEDYNPEIKQAYEDCIKSIKKLLKETKHDIKVFSQYLFTKVMILRVSVPRDTDLNHYFEIMNNRGEQLEKHEILKAKFLEVLKDDDSLGYAFTLIWEACSNMEKYVQYGFKVGHRSKIFGETDWNTLIPKDIDELSALIFDEENIELIEPPCSILTLLDIKTINDPSDRNKDENPDRFLSVINFPNFLLHVLRIQTEENIPLDDKQLLLTFKPYLEGKKENVLQFVKEFGHNLLKIKHLYDKFIIKREFIKGSDRWSLKRLKRQTGTTVSYANTFGEEEDGDGENKNIVMLLSMFHVSTPTMGYKYWLNASLKFVFEKEKVVASEYIQHLENLSEAYLYDRFIAISPLDYYEIININKGISNNNSIDETLLNKGCDVENFIFNYLDYLLWRTYHPEFNQFDFTQRSSVEHYYPQTPMEGYEKLEPKYLNNFGNLCLIATNKNSKLSNLPPEAKKAYYLKNPNIESIKQSIMMREPNRWKVEIEKHDKEMRIILLSKNNNGI